MTFIDPLTDTRTLVSNWPYGFQYIDNGDPLWNYLSAYVTEFQEIETQANELYDQRFLDTATGKELEKLAAEVGVIRETGESDDALRFRAQLRKAIAASNGTAEDIKDILILAFGEDTLADIDVTDVSGEPVTSFNLPQESLDDIPLSLSEFESELERAFPAGYGVRVTTSDTWLLGQSGSQGIGQGALI